ncbi:MAG: OsmC family protein [Bacteroidota bacterium]
MTEIISTGWLGNMAFESTIDNYTFKMDASENFGGTGQGPRPKPMVLSALAGCTGMDVISILAKKKVIPKSFNIRISGTMNEENPRYYQKIHIVYELSGDGYSQNEEILTKVKRAVELSRESYCGVSAMLKKACDITDEVVLLDS